jgi:ABC-type transport system involved in cytochrome bd biosynthesis fused ATPase/permease subunit
MLPFLAPYKWCMLTAAILGFLAIGTNVGLMGTSGYLIASAALRPDTILLLWVPIVGVRFFGLSRAVFRYLERLVSHDLTFRVLARIRVWLYARLEPQAPQLLEGRRSGDILSSVVSDVEQMQNFYLRVLAPPVIALMTAVLGYLIQRQRLSLARALLRQAPIVLFDEPTTGLDSLTEKAFLASAQAALQERAVLWITHRLIGLEAMDEILVLRNGQLSERGKHQDLLDSKGYYHQLHQLQKEHMLWTQIPGEVLK